MSAFGGGAEPRPSAEFVATMDFDNFIATFGETIVDLDKIRPCCSIYFTEDDLDAAIRVFEIELITTKTLNLCLRSILGGEIHEERVLSDPKCKIVCLTALFGNYYREILTTPDRNALWESVKHDFLPNEWVVHSTMHSGMGEITSHREQKYSSTIKFVTTAYATHSSYYFNELNIVDPQKWLGNNLDKYLSELSIRYFKLMGDMMIDEKNKFVKTNADEHKETIKSIFKIHRLRESYNLHSRDTIHLFETFMTGEENGGSTKKNSTIFALILKASEELRTFFKKYLIIKLSNATDSEIEYYRKNFESIDAPDMNELIIDIQKKKSETSTYAFACFKSSDNPNFLQTPVFELLVALAQKDRNDNALMMLSSLQFCNPEITRDTFINRLMRREYARDEFRLGPLIALFDSLAENMVVYDNGCKSCPASATHISEAFDKGIVGSSQDEYTQDALKYVDSLSTAAGGGGSIQTTTEDAEIDQLAYQIEKNYSELATFNKLTTGVALPIPTHNAVLQSFGYTEDIDLDQKQEIIKNMYSMLQEIEYIAEGKKEFYQMFGGKSKTKRKRSNKTKRRRRQKKSTRKKRR